MALALTCLDSRNKRPTRPLFKDATAAPNG